MKNEIMSKEELIAELRSLSMDMINLGGTMEYLAGFDADIREKGIELLGAGMIAKNWADNIEAENG